MKKASLALAVALSPWLGNAYGVESEMTASPTPLNTTIGLDIASSYIFRGFTVNKNPSLQPTLKATAGGLTLGTWGSFPMDREEGELEQEVDLYATYDRAVGAFVFSIGAIEYTYPESDLDNDREIMLKAALTAPLSPSLAIYHGLEGAVEKSTYYELAGKQELYSTGRFSSALRATLGYLDSDAGEDGLSHLTLTATASYAVVTASLNYVAETDADVNDLSEQEQVYVATGASFAF